MRIADPRGGSVFGSYLALQSSRAVVWLNISKDQSVAKCAYDAMSSLDKHNNPTSGG